MNARAGATLFALSLTLSGCVGLSVEYDGNPIAETDLEQIQVGVTTRAQILELLGSPKVIERADITGLAEQVLARYQGESLTLQIDPSLFNDVYIYERRQTDRWAMLFGFFNYVTSDTRSDLLSVFFDQEGLVLGVGWTPGREDM
jgi:SmpA / OmlA family